MMTAQAAREQREYAELLVKAQSRIQAEVEGGYSVALVSIRESPGKAVQRVMDMLESRGYSIIIREGEHMRISWR